MDFTQPYNRTTWHNFLEDVFLPEDFRKTEENIAYSGKYIEKVTKLGECKDSLKLNVYEILHNSVNDARVSLSKEAFNLIRSTNNNKALLLFIPKNSNGIYRFSYVEFTPIQDDSGAIKRTYTNPRRYSYILGKECMLHTPTKYLINNGRIKEQTRNAKLYTANEDLVYRFSIEVLTQEFYNSLFNWYDKWAIDIVKFPVGSGSSVTLKKGDQNRIHLIRLITRFIFVWFIKQKKLVPDWLFDENEVKKVLKNFKSDSEKDGNYYNGIIQNLFFATLNKKINEREFAYDKGANQRKEDYGIKTKFRDTLKDSMFAINKEEFITKFESIPFLNGGLFECLDNFDTKEYIDGFSREKDRCAVVPNALFWGKDEANKRKPGLIEIFNTFNFTIEENTPQDIDVALDPELLGKVFENLLGTYNEETSSTARNESGSFYTPREIVDYMVDTSLTEYLLDKLGSSDEVTKTKLKNLFDYSIEGHEFNTDETSTLITAIHECKILDPACGSGAFPMGILNRLIFIMNKLDSDNKLWKKLQIKKVQEDTGEAYSDIEDTGKREIRLKEIEEVFEMSIGKYRNYARKLFLIENCIFGVDIQPIAIQISKLRFFISLIVDQQSSDDKENNYNVLPLPNLETKFVAANTLVGIKNDHGFLDSSEEITKKQKELLRIRHKHFSARDAKEKINLRKEDEKICKILSDLLQELGFYNQSDAELLTKWNPYNQSESASFFDPAWMFGLSNENTSLKTPPVQVSGYFDIVIGNPPYFVYKNERLELLEKIKQQEYYTYTGSGKLNAYRAFIAKSLKDITKTNGILCMIFQNSFLGDTFVAGLRKYIFANHKILKIDSFPQRDNTSKRVFAGVKMSVCILTCKNGNSTDNFILNLFSDREFNCEYSNIININDIILLDPKNLSIPLIKPEELSILVKIYKFPKLEIKAIEGEINMTFHKHLLSENNKNPEVLKGAAIQRYRISKKLSQGKHEYLSK